MLLAYNKSDKFVRQQQKLGNDVRWDGWVMVFFRPDKRGVYSPSGSYRDGQWGFEKRVSVSDDGKWRVPNKFVNRPVRTARAG